MIYQIHLTRNLTKTAGVFLMKHLADEVSFKHDGQQVDLTLLSGVSGGH
jgi:hypothetical protein